MPFLLNTFLVKKPLIQEDADAKIVILSLGFQLGFYNNNKEHASRLHLCIDIFPPKQKQIKDFLIIVRLELEYSSQTQSCSSCFVELVQVQPMCLQLCRMHGWNCLKFKSQSILFTQILPVKFGLLHLSQFITHKNEAEQERLVSRCIVDDRTITKTSSIFSFTI